MSEGTDAVREGGAVALGHTPGPWECDGGEFHQDPELAGYVSYFVKLPCGPLISKANADLIAAAPDILAALELCEENLRLIHEALGPVTKGSPMPRACTFDAWRAADAAIKKARALPPDSLPSSAMRDVRGGER